MYTRTNLESIEVPGEFVSATLTPYGLDCTLVVNMEPIRGNYDDLFTDDGEMRCKALTLVQMLVSYGMHTKYDAFDFYVEVFSNDATDLIFDLSYSHNHRDMTEEDATDLAEKILADLLPFTENDGLKSVYDTVSKMLKM